MEKIEKSGVSSSEKFESGENVSETRKKLRRITGIQTYSGAIYRCKCVVLCTGTYLRARCIYGEVSTNTGPNGLQTANYLTDSLKSLGIRMYRFKTGTPARIDKKSIDFSKMEESFRFPLQRIRILSKKTRHPAG